uniref:Uncharacterized protein n=1 Tax=Anopheles atroparvus TaxID=41427 RepID=A0A182J6P0_ANOAO
METAAYLPVVHPRSRSCVRVKSYRFGLMVLTAWCFTSGKNSQPSSTDCFLRAPATPKINPATSPPTTVRFQAPYTPPAAKAPATVRSNRERRGHADERTGEVHVPGDGRQVALRLGHHHHLDRRPAETAGQGVLVGGQHLAEEILALRLVVVVGL